MPAAAMHEAAASKQPTSPYPHPEAEAPSTAQSAHSQLHQPQPMLRHPMIIAVPLGAYHTSLLERILHCRALLVKQLSRVPASTVQASPWFVCDNGRSVTMVGID
eukprot:scaffold245609_cov18-Tisochrysis_lutea.AAC.1